ncbi:35974_t:CDS:2, partial [Gigaspora margarita]
ADGKVRDEFAARFPGKGKVERRRVLDAAWPKIRLSKPREYDFLTKIGRLGARAVTLRLADNKGWNAALQIVGSNDKIMEKYKDRIPLVGQVEPMFRASNWVYRSRSKYRQQKRKRYCSPSSDSERGELYKKGKKRNRGVIPFVEKKVSILQNIEEQLHVSTAVELDILHQVALHKVRKQPVNPEMKTDHTRGMILRGGSRNMMPAVIESQLSVVGKMQTSETLNYWQQKIGPAPVVVDWLMNDVPLYPREVLVIAIQPVPKQYTLSAKQVEWVQKELSRLVASSAVGCLGNQSEGQIFFWK